MASLPSFASIPTTIAQRPEAAMAHGVCAALRLGTRLEVVRLVDAPSPTSREVAVSEARGVLRRWRAKDPSRLRIDPLEAVCQGPDDPARDDEVVTVLAETHAAMVVVNRREGRGSASAQASLAAAIAWRARVPVLAVGDEDLVDPKDGSGRMHRVVVPVGSIRNAQALTEAAVWFTTAFVDHPVQIVFVQIRPEPEGVALRAPAMAGDSIVFTTRSGEVVQALVAEAIERRADAVVLPLGIEIGASGAILDSSKLVELVRMLPMPVLTVPMRHRWRPPPAPESVRVVQVVPAAPPVRSRARVMRLP